MPASIERLFYRTQILANAEAIFPSHNLKLVTTEDNPGRKRRIRIISSTTGQILLEQDGVDDNGFLILFGRVERMLADMVKGGGVEGWSGGGGGGGGGSASAGCLSEGGNNSNEAKEKLKNENEALRRENEVLKMQLTEKKFEMMEAKIAEETRRREELQRRVAVLEQRRQGMDTPSTWDQLSFQG
jgi:septin family protein